MPSSMMPAVVQRGGAGGPGGPGGINLAPPPVVGPGGNHPH
jgi:hypothetical protein